MAIELLRPGRGLWRGPSRELNQMEQMMERMFHRRNQGWPWILGEAEALGWAPAVDVVDRKDEVVLRADLPGMTDKDVELSMQDVPMVRFPARWPSPLTSTQSRSVRLSRTASWRYIFRKPRKQKGERSRSSHPRVTSVGTPYWPVK
jgi:hypothetical protein